MKLIRNHFVDAHVEQQQFTAYSCSINVISIVGGFQK